jgi:DNA-binding NarL/FixJ family response regulator
MSKKTADLVITDLFMPEKEGLETIMELQRDFPEVKIIAISGGDRKGTLDFLPMSRKLGASIALKKPFGVDDILNAVSSLLAG